MNVNDEYIVKIEKLTNEGLGLAKVDNFVIFVSDVCPNDIVKIKIVKVNKKYSFGQVIEIVTPSKYRVRPFCPMQKVCGACQLQFIDYDYQLEIKSQITKEALHSIAGLFVDVPKTVQSPEIKCYRHKIQYPVSQTKNSKRIVAGYYKPKTHEIVNVKYCPIQPEICDKIIEYIKQTSQDLGINAYLEKNKSGELRHIVLRHSASNEKVLVAFVVNSKNVSDKIRKLCEMVFNEFDEVCGVCVNFNDKNSNVILGTSEVCIVGQDYIKENLLGIDFKVGVSTFFQVNIGTAENIFRYVKNYISENFKSSLLLDAYAGISAFGLCMADVCSSVVSVEENSQACAMARQTALDNNIKNIEINNMDAAKFFAQEKRLYDVVLLDPPRKGCSELSLDEAYRLCKDTIIYVSCNSATLARDLKHLVQKGCTVESVQPFDMFCHTYHIENVAIIKVNR